MTDSYSNFMWWCSAHCSCFYLCPCYMKLEIYTVIGVMIQIKLIIMKKWKFWECDMWFFNTLWIRFDRFNLILKITLENWNYISSEIIILFHDFHYMNLNFNLIGLLCIFFVIKFFSFSFTVAHVIVVMRSFKKIIFLLSIPLILYKLL
jgi:hypothetical protein